MQVSLHSAEVKTAEILLSLRSIFAEKGFDGASMQDMARAAGMSAGNFYRYFPSKNAIIQSLISADMHEMGRDFESILQSENPMATLRTQMRGKICHHQRCSDGILWAEINAVAMRKPEVGALLQKMEEQVAAYLSHIFALHTGTPQDSALAVFAPQAQLIITLFRAAAMIGSQHSHVKDQLTDQIITLIEQTLDQISGLAQKV